MTDKQNLQSDTMFKKDMQVMKDIHILYTNADSLTNKLNELQLVLKSLTNKPTVIAITEVKHKTKWHTELCELSLDGYEILHNDLQNAHRGVVIYIDSRAIFRQLDFNTEVSEYVSVEFKCGCSNLVLTTIYRSPNSTQQNDMAINDLIDKICNHQRGYKLFVGDFNFNQIDWVNLEVKNSNNSCINFMKVIQDNYLIQHIKEPTRVRGSDEPSVLDLVLTDDDFINDIEHLSPLGKSDHAILNISCNLTPMEICSAPKYNYSKGNYDALRAFMNLDWERFFGDSCEDVEIMWSAFKDKLVQGIERFIPKIGNFNEWKKSSWKNALQRHTREKIRKKHRLWTRYIETRNTDYLIKYRKVRNEVRNETRRIYKEQQNAIAKATKSNPKKFWSYVKSKTSVKSSIGDIKYNCDGKDIIITEDYQKATAFNDYFASVFTKEDTKELSIIPPKIVTSTPGIIEFSDTKVKERIEHINITKSPGPDGLHPRILKELKDEISHPLSILFQKSFSCKRLPRDWITANITAIYKKGKKADLSNYRPVSLTSIICKIMESLVREYILNYFNDNDFFSKKQFGFLKGRSTAIQLLNIIDKWSEYLETGGQINVIYTDFAKAFDKVPHKRLIHKLRSYGLDEELIAWIEAFLVGRQQRVKINGTFSNWIDVLSGIPQGTILGPLLFVIYINDLPDVCDHLAEIYLFADDAKLFRHIQTEEDHIMLQSGLDELQKWSDTWLLQLNVDKCKTVFYGRNINTNYDYCLHCNTLGKEDYIKDLGVIFDTDLSFSRHCREKMNKAYSMLGIIKRNFMYLSETAFVTLYKTMVRSHLEYAHSVWNPHREGLIKDLEKVQMRATKLIKNIKYLTYTDRLKHLNLPTLKYRRIRGDMIEVYKILTNRYHKDVNLHFERNLDQRTRGHSQKLVTIRCHYDLRKFSFGVRVINIWNSLPEKVVSADTVQTFKNRLDKFWRNQDIVFNYKANIIGSTSRSALFNDDDDDDFFFT